LGYGVAMERRCPVDGSTALSDCFSGGSARTCVPIVGGNGQSERHDGGDIRPDEYSIPENPPISVGFPTDIGGFSKGLRKAVAPPPGNG